MIFCILYFLVQQITYQHDYSHMEKIFCLGDVITFDNWRLLHGRQSYEAGTEISRHLEGAYADWDVVMSRLRILRQSVQNRN